MELVSVGLIFDLCGLGLILKVAVLIFSVLDSRAGLESCIGRSGEAIAHDVFIVDGVARLFGEGFAVQIFRLEPGDVASVPWHVLSLDIGGGSAEPVLTLARCVAEC